MIIKDEKELKIAFENFNSDFIDDLKTVDFSNVGKCGRELCREVGVLVDRTFAIKFLRKKGIQVSAFNKIYDITDKVLWSYAREYNLTFWGLYRREIEGEIPVLQKALLGTCDKEIKLSLLKMIEILERLSKSKNVQIDNEDSYRDFARSILAMLSKNSPYILCDDELESLETFISYHLQT